MFTNLAKTELIFKMHAEKKELIALLSQFEVADLSLPSVSKKRVSKDDADSSRHNHWQREVTFVLRGNPSLVVGDVVLGSRKGSVFIVNRWVNHSVWSFPECNGSVIATIHFHDIVWWNMSVITETGCWEDQEWSWAAADKDLASFANRRMELWNESTGSDLDRFNEFLRIPLFLLLDDYSKNLFGRYNNPGFIQNNIIDLVQSRIENSHGRNCSLDQLAEYSGYSKFRLAHLFKEKTGKTVGCYIDEVRINYLLFGHIGGKKHKEVAYELGFKSPSAFSTWLRKKRDEIDIDF